MKVTHVICDINQNSGGTSTYLKDILNTLPTQIKNNLVCFYSKDALKLKKETRIYYVNDSKNGLKWYSKEFKNIFDTLSTDIFHGNGLWDYPTHAMSVYARKNKIPYIISPHGMLEPWSLEQSAVKKKIALKLFQNKDLKKANCIHATSELEALNIRKLGLNNPIAIIPNGINMEEFPEYKRQLNTRRKVLFLSRIHNKKGIELLIEAWKELDQSITQNWEVEIVGNGEQAYIKSLTQLINNLELEESISISKPVFDNAKIKKYQNADLFVLPTYSENFGIVVAEALALKLPVITTKGTPWEDLNTYKCGDWIDIGKDPLKQSLRLMLSKSPKELEEIGCNGRKLIEDKYSMTSVAKQMTQLYQWILYKTEKPEFVIED